MTKHPSLLSVTQTAGLLFGTIARRLAPVELVVERAVETSARSPCQAERHRSSAHGQGGSEAHDQ